MKNLRLFLPQIASYQLNRFAELDNYQESLEMEPLRSDWESLFCSYVGLQAEKLPWTQLRMAQFQLAKNAKTAVCCDPVLMQLTHRGAYMLGQDSMGLSQSEAIRIVAQINERLMRDGEQLLLIDKFSWLFTSEKTLELSGITYKNLIGKDVFDYPYQGEDANFWQQLATEIQMLIKQMVDYQGVSETSPETLLNVHFSGAVAVDTPEEIPFIKNDAIAVVTDNELIQAFCSKSFLSQYAFSQISDVSSSDVNQPDVRQPKIEQENLLLFAFESECEQYPDLVKFWLSSYTNHQLETCELVCQDVVIRAKSRPSLFTRIRKLFNY